MKHRKPSSMLLGLAAVVAASLACANPRRGPDELSPAAPPATVETLAPQSDPTGAALESELDQIEAASEAEEGDLQEIP